jgi:cation diffusion facilitator family transporter
MAENRIKIAGYSTILNAALVIAKGVLAFFTGSTALLAETTHSITDLLGSLLVLGGITLSRKQNPSFPWGLYKVENITAIVSAFFIFLMAYEIGKDVFLSGAKQIRHINLTIIIMLFMTVPIFIFTQYEKRKGAALNSPSLVADAKHWLTDIASMGVVIAGFAGLYVYPYADKIAAALVIALVLKTGFSIVKDSLKSLLDASVDARTLEKIKWVLKKFSEVQEVKSVNARNSGSFIFVHLDIRLSIKKLEEAHQLADMVESAIKKEIPFVERVSIHYEPTKREYTQYAVPLASREGEISGHFGSAPFIGIWNMNINNRDIMLQQVLENPFLQMEKGKGIKLAEFLIEKGANVLYINKPFEGKGPGYVFSNSEVEVRLTDKETIKQLMHDII